MKILEKKNKKENKQENMKNHDKSMIKIHRKHEQIL